VAYPYEKADAVGVVVVVVVVVVAGVVVGQTGSQPVAVDFPEYHDVRPVSFSFDIYK